MPGDTLSPHDMEKIAHQESAKNPLEGMAAHARFLNSDESPVFLVERSLRNLDEEISQHFRGGARITNDLEDFRQRFSGVRTELEETLQRICNDGAVTIEDEGAEKESLVAAVRNQVEEIASRVANIAKETEDEFVPALTRFANKLEDAGSYSSSDEIRTQARRLDDHMREMAESVRRMNAGLE